MNASKLTARLFHPNSFATSSMPRRSYSVVSPSARPGRRGQARELWQDGKPDEYFFLEMYGAAVVEHLITAARRPHLRLGPRRTDAALPHFSPGYSGWDVSISRIVAVDPGRGGRSFRRQP